MNRGGNNFYNNDGYRGGGGNQWRGGGGGGPWNRGGGGDYNRGGRGGGNFGRGGPRGGGPGGGYGNNWRNNWGGGQEDDFDGSCYDEMGGNGGMRGGMMGGRGMMAGGGGGGNWQQGGGDGGMMGGSAGMMGGNAGMMGGGDQNQQWYSGNYQGNGQGGNYDHYGGGGADYSNNQQPAQLQQPFRRYDSGSNNSYGGNNQQDQYGANNEGQHDEQQKWNQQSNQMQPRLNPAPPVDKDSQEAGPQPPKPPEPPADNRTSQDQEIEEITPSEKSSKKSRSRSRSRDRRRRRSRSKSHSRRRSRSNRRRGGRNTGSRSRSRSRDRRSRSRSRDSRRRRRSRSRSRSRSNRRRRDRSRSSGGKKRSLDRSNENMGQDGGGVYEGTNTVMIRGLPVYILEQDVIDNILTHGLEPKEVRLIRKKDTGESRGFAFVEFSSIDEAREWIEAEQGMLQFGTWKVTMQFSQSQSEDIRRNGCPEFLEPARNLQDWYCKKCDIQNFKRREACFKCGGRRPEPEVPAALLEEEDESSPHPSKTLLFTNLDPLTVEDTVWESAQSFSRQPIKNVTIPRDKLTNMSRGVAHVEMHSIMDSMMLYKRLTETSINIDGRKLIVAYKRSEKKQEEEPSEENVALEEERKKAGRSFTEEEITKMAEFSADLYAKHAAERVSFIEYYKKYYREGGDPTPALKAIYGDKKKAANNLAANAVGAGNAMGAMQAAAAALQHQGDGEKEKKGGKDSKVKTAKKIQKDMEKWAKQLNQKSKGNTSSAPVQAPAPMMEPAAPERSGGMEDVAFSILQKKNIQSIAAEQGVDTDDFSALEAQFSDWANFTCLLCKRAFPSKEKLMKHNNVSDLHKENIQNWRTEQIEKRVALAGSGYRDRAAERRNKYGVVDEAPQNKFKDKYNRVMEHLSSSSKGGDGETKIQEDNVGNKMLQKMGWKEGLGLGKDNQGRTDIIRTDDGRTNSAGLGVKTARLSGVDDYRVAAKATLFSRFNER